MNADLINSIIYIISGISSPFIGLIIGKIGGNIYFVLIGAITTLIAHLALTFTLLNPWYFIVLIAISYSTIACTIWPMISTIVHKHHLGTAFGIGQAAQNLSLAIATWIGGIIIDKKGYFFLQVYFVIWVSCKIFHIIKCSTIILFHIIVSIVFIIQLVIYRNNKPSSIKILQENEE